MRDTGAGTSAESPAVLRRGLPRVNLLPPEVGESNRVRGLRLGLAAALLLSSAAVGLGAAAAAGQVDQAEGELEAATATRTRVEGELRGLQSVRQVTARVEAAEALVSAARLSEIPWSRQLNDLSLTLPHGVWVESMTVAPPTAAAPTAGAEQSYGTITYTGRGRSHNDVALWLETLAAQPGLADPTLSTSSRDDSLAEQTVTFTSSVTITAESLRNQPES